MALCEHTDQINPWLINLWAAALKYCQKSDIDLAYWRNLPAPRDVTDSFVLAEVAWCIYNAGMKESTIRQKWKDLRRAFCNFNPFLIIKLESNCSWAAFLVFNHRKKAEAVISAARKIVHDSPVSTKLAAMDNEAALEYFKDFDFIGDVTKYHVARNVGFDVVKPDRHLVRLAEICNYPSPDALVSDVVQLTGERKGYTDYVFWAWLAGKDGYEEARRICTKGRKNSVAI